MSEKTNIKNAVAKNNGNKKADQKKKRGINKLALFIAMMIAAGIIGVIIALIDFFGVNPVRRSISMSMEFTYDGAAQNLLPNGKTFTIDGILRDDVIGDALAELDLQNYYSVDSIRNSMIVNGSFPQDVIERISKYNSVYDYSVYRTVEQDNYYPTVYTVTLYDDYSAKTTKLEMQEILETIVKKYKEYFIKNYVYSYSYSEKETILNIADVDYRHQLNLIDGKIDTLKDYANYLYKKDPNFLYKNLNFKDFTVKCNDLEKNNLSNLEAIVMMKAYSKSPDRLKKMYQYRIKLLKNEQKRTEERLEEINKLRDSYEMDEILYVGMNADSTVKVDSNSRKTYEELTSRKASISDRITTINEEIAKNNEFLADLTSASNNSSAEDEINAVNEKLKVIELDFTEMISAYNSYIVNENNIMVSAARYTAPKLFSGSFIKRAVKVTAPVCMVFLIMFCVIMVLQERKKIA